MADENVVTLQLDSPGALRIRIGDKAGGRFVVADAPTVDAFIAQLAAFRRQMPPEVPRTLGNGQQAVGEVGPIWMGTSPAEADDKTLSIRHPGNGWLSFLFLREDAQLLSDYLRPVAPKSSDRNQPLQ